MDLDVWNIKKKSIDKEKRAPYFKEWQIWFLSVWLNIWVESKWKGDNFSRPVLIIKKFNNQMFLWVPLTTKYKDNKYVEKIKNINWKESFLLLSQIRIFSNKRLNDKIWSLYRSELFEIKDKIKERLF